MSNVAGEIQVVLFDIGGVLVELQGVPTILAWMGNKLTPDELLQLWLGSPAVRDFETGRTGPERFADQIIQELSLPVRREEFISCFSSWLSGLYPGARELVSSVPARFTRATLANTSVLHWPRLMKEFELEQAFHHHFPSHITGKIKPDPDAFQQVIHALGCEPREIFFLDDNRLNVDAAKQIGIHAVRVKSPAQARQALEAAGILPAVDENKERLLDN
jgi:glucose-1-phosphatase